MNLQALAAMDDCEHATGKTLEEHERVRTPQEVIDDFLDVRGNAAWGQQIITDLRAAGYQIVQVVSTGNKPFP